MKKNWLVAFLIGLFSFSASAQIQLPTFSDLCSYEPDCGKVTERDGRRQIVKSIPDHWIEYYDNLRTEIIRIAEMYDVDAVTLALTPMAENTMNVTVGESKLEELTDENGEIPIYGEMSIGPGQIYVSTAKKVEELAARIERRPVRTKKKYIKPHLKTPIGALKYAAAILRAAQDAYKAEGFDISKRPEILATLYNIGKYERRARWAKNRRDQQLLPNYFGFFVGKQYEFVKKRLHLPSKLDD